MKCISLIAIFLALSVFPSLAQVKNKLPNDPLIIDLQKEKENAKDLLSSEVTIKGTLVAHGNTRQGGVIADQGFNFSDGTHLSILEGDYKSFKAAHQLFQKYLKSAIKVLEHENIHSEKKDFIIGEKVLLILRNSEDEEYTFARITWYKSYIKQTTSSSLKHLLAFELENKK